MENENGLANWASDVDQRGGAKVDRAGDESAKKNRDQISCAHGWSSSTSIAEQTELGQQR